MKMRLVFVDFRIKRVTIKRKSKKVKLKESITRKILANRINELLDIFS